MSPRLVAALLLVGGVLSPALAGEAPPPLPREDIIRALVPGAVRFLERIADPAKAGRFSTRDLFTQALTLGEAHQALDRLEVLFAAAEPLQDRDRGSPTYGNFRWYADDTAVTDRNAVDFCMQGAAPLWIRHHEALPAAARERLRGLVTIGIEGLKGHQVAPTYTNIALMNAGNLILLGEALGRIDAADEGYARLDRFLLAMWEGGTHEYDSPTYYGVDLEDLELIVSFAKRERGLAQARKLLEFFWRDIALSWYPPAQKLAGARSRDYDYLSGLGMLDHHLLANGWLSADGKDKVGDILCAFTAWHPASELWTLAQSGAPRLVTQVWGAGRDQVRALWRCPDVVLSAAGAGYGGRMDFPLCVDLPGARTRPRLFFTPDGRHDPYGKAKILESRSGHMKALHLSPFWAASQRRGDALALVVYREGDLSADTTGLESHLVIPREVDGFWMGGRRLAVTGQAADQVLAGGQVLALRQGTAAVGIRVVWARDQEGKEVQAHLVDDGNPHGVVRLSIDHHLQRGPGKTVTGAGAAFWLRVGSGLATDAAFEAWLSAFSTAAMDAQADAGQVALRVAGLEGPLALAAAAPFATATTVEPAWPRHLLACDGDDAGARLLADLEPISSQRQRRERVQPVMVAGTTMWEAEAGFTVEPVVVAEDAHASGGRFAWMPAAPGERKAAAGSVSWPLTVTEPGRYYLWGRVRAASSENDSFFVSLTLERQELVANATWAIGTHGEWTWVRFARDGGKPEPLALTAGHGELTLRTREAGAMIDRLCLTTRADETPR